MTKLIEALQLHGTPAQDMNKGQLLLVLRQQWAWVDVLFLLGVCTVIFCMTSIAVAGTVSVVLALVTQQQRLSKRLDAAARLLERMSGSD